ncbi:hypothetical protein [Rhodococcus sp. NPDC127528]|uniref:hypothetical protein n=1 Tax=unclassified Rhodococcus (in: high G+C Gram-positive bacteria) TaxID=192944 RepID=UPI00362688FC
MTAPRRGFSYGRLALYSLGAAAAVLVVAAAAVAALRPSPVVGLVIVLVGVAGAIAAMGAVSTRMTRRAFDDADAGPEPAREPDPDTGPEH